MENTKYVIKSLSMTNYLIRKGFDMVGAADNERNSNLKVFYFIDSSDLRTAMSNFNKSN